MKSVIELVKTAQGYSIIQQGHEINKVSGRIPKQKSYSAVPKKFSQQSFTIYPYTYIQEPEYNQKYIIVPAKSQWFNLNQVHELQRKALPQWFKTKKVVFGAVKPDKFEKNQELYKRYRNYIIDLARNQYISPTKARKGLAGDVCAILKIHSFLQKNGLINYVFPKKRNVNLQLQNNFQENIQNKLLLIKRKDCLDKDKTIVQKHFDKDHLELLKKITNKFRPICHLCQGICGVIWYQYQEQLCLKKFTKLNQTDNQFNGKKQVQQRKEDNCYTKQTKKIVIESSSKPFKYMLRLCASCFTTGSIPVVLTIQNFKKRSVIDGVTYQYEEPRDKKKANEQNRIIQMIQKYRFNLKKTAESLKITQQNLYQILLCMPIIKIQKLARIDPQTQTEQVNQKLEKNGISNHKQQKQKLTQKQVKQEANKTNEQLVKLFAKQLNSAKEQQIRLYEEFIQIWLLKISAKLTKLSDWQKSTNWFTSRLIHDQRNTLAETLKNKQ